MKNGKGCLLLIGLAVVFVLVITKCGGGGGGSLSSARQDQAGAKALAYLRTEVKEIAWVEFDGNNAYIGFSEQPTDLSTVMRAAAMNANRATGFGYHVWAVDATVADAGWRPGGDGLVCNVSARGGKIEKDTCFQR